MTNEPIKLKRVFNPTSEDLNFKWNNAEYTLPAEKGMEFVDYIAEHAAKKLADKNIMTTNQDEHRVLVNCYLENSDPEVIAKNLGINLTKIRKDALIEKNKEARQFNLEAQVQELNKKVAELLNEREKPQEADKKQEESDKPKKVFACKNCEEKFDMPIKLAAHTHSTHKKEKKVIKE